jgi:hypothetical protein
VFWFVENCGVLNCPLKRNACAALDAIQQPQSVVSEEQLPGKKSSTGNAIDENSSHGSSVADESDAEHSFVEMQ